MQLKQHVECLHFSMSQIHVIAPSRESYNCIYLLKQQRLLVAHWHYLGCIKLYAQKGSRPYPEVLKGRNC